MRHYLTFSRQTGTQAIEEISKLIRGPGKAQLEDDVLKTLPRWKLTLKDKPCDHTGDTEVCRISFRDRPDNSLLEDINGRLATLNGQEPARGAISGVGADLRIHVTDYWSPRESPDPIFGTRNLANQLMSIEPYEQPENEGGVNVVIIDQGLNKDYIRSLRNSSAKDLPENFVGGWYCEESRRAPGEFPIGHGSMLARNILSIAPQARLLDLPLIPEEIENLPRFLSDAHAAFSQLRANVVHLRESKDERWKQPWVLINAWAAYRGSHEDPNRHYTENLQHQFNRLVGEMAQEFDMIFAAGNCGEYCPSALCGPADCGPGRSISGANSHPKVLTVGAVRADGVWLGYSSQGPGTLTKHKPDLCAASQFCEEGDAGVANTGTSAACAVVGGAVAALRSTSSSAKLPGAKIYDILKDTASSKPPGGWDAEVGCGILNLDAAKRRASAAIVGASQAGDWECKAS